MKEPESQEHFDSFFNTSGLSVNDCMSRVEELLVELRHKTSKLATEWILTHGYFNGRIDNTVRTHSLTNMCQVTVTLTCYGLPLRIDDEHLRAIEACKRYFEHCRRVSISAGHKGCDSGEMAVRMALKGEAVAALAKVSEAEAAE